MTRARRTAPPPPPSWPARPDVLSSTPIYTDGRRYVGEVVALRSGGFEAVGLHGRHLAFCSTSGEALAAVTKEDNR